MKTRPVAILVAVAVIIGGTFVAWRWVGQRVDVVMVNASGQLAQFTWQPQLFTEAVTVPVGGCESKSVQLLAGETWRFDSDSLAVDSARVTVPLFATDVAFEIWLNADGTSRVVPAYAVDGPVSAPYPACPSPGS